MVMSKKRRKCLCVALLEAEKSNEVDYCLEGRRQGKNRRVVYQEFVRENGPAGVVRPFCAACDGVEEHQEAGSV